MSTISSDELDRIVNDTLWSAMRDDSSGVKTTMSPIFDGDSEDVYNGLISFVAVVAQWLPKPVPGHRVQLGFVPQNSETGELGEIVVDDDGNPVIPEAQANSPDYVYMRMLVAVMEERPNDFASLFRAAYLAEDATTIPRLFIVAIKSASGMLRNQIARLN